MLLFLACTQSGSLDSGGSTESAECSGPTWHHFGEGFFRTWCQSCHSSTTPDRSGAPEALDYETYDQVLAGADTIRDAVLVRGSMPLGGGVYPQDLELLEAFLDCPSEGTPGGEDTEAPRAQPTLEGPDVVERVAQVLPSEDMPEPLGARDALVRWLEHATASCPHVAGLSINAPWEGCDADGYTFSGLTEFIGNSSATGVSAFDLLADFSFTAPDGSTFDGGGTAVLAFEDEQALYELTGTWKDDTADGWIHAFSGNLTVAVGETARLDGSVQRDGLSVHLDDVTVDPACTDGVVEVRDDVGWHRLELDCGCGPWTFEGQAQGELCIDLAPQLAGLRDKLELP
ncbi:MAG: hypothetical protein GY913_06585 [Proteobacteria bacterium]|nr:hypothetical protein [Pseudomonadota bacterium]MCP4916572.1 hypothetical protein [Pseudomonadota bacterium]